MKIAVLPICLMLMLPSAPAWAASVLKCEQESLGMLLDRAMDSPHTYLIVEGTIKPAGNLRVEEHVYGQHWSAQQEMEFYGRLVGGWPARELSIMMRQKIRQASVMPEGYTDNVADAFAGSAVERLWFFRQAEDGMWEHTVGLCGGVSFLKTNQDEQEAIMSCLAEGACSPQAHAILGRNK